MNAKLRPLCPSRALNLLDLRHRRMRKTVALHLQAYRLLQNKSQNC